MTSNATPADDAGLRPEEFAEAARAPIEDAKDRDPRAAARVLAEAGLTGVLAAEADGGLGLDLAFAVPIAEAAGGLQLRLPLVESMLLARALAGTPAAAAIASGERTATIAWQGSLAAAFAGHARLAGDSDWLLVAESEAGTDFDVAHDTGPAAVLVEVAGLAIETVGCLDPEVPQAWLRLDGAKVVARVPADTMQRLQHDARILFAAFVTGAAQGAIQRSANHVSTRVQFGRPLSSRQAVRHWLSRMQLLTEVSAAATRRVLATDEYGHARDARPVLANAIANATFVLEKAIHLHGGMGFTWEMPLHRSLRDIRAIDAAFGAGSLVEAVGDRFIATA